MLQWLEITVQDVRFAARGWRKAPAFALAATGTLAIGIGANTAIFSVVSGVLLRHLPFADSSSLVQVNETQPRNSRQTGFDGPVVFQDFEEWRSRSSMFSGMITYANSARNYQGVGEPEQVATVTAERGLFRLLGVSAALGRTFEEGDSLQVAVASYGFWKEALGSDPSAIGRAVTLDGHPYALIGVMPEGFQFPYAASSHRLWIPWEPPPDLRSHPNRRIDSVLGRLKPGIGVEAARQELAAMGSVSQGGRIVRLTRLKDVVSGAVRESLLVLLGAVGMVLLVSCLNVANLLLARTAARAREIAVRTAVGATGARLVRQFLTESLLLSAVGGTLGLVLGVVGRRVLLRLAGGQIPRAGETGLDWRVFAFLVTVSVLTGIGFGLAPALTASRGVAVHLARRGVSSTLRDTLVVAEIALAFILLAGAGLLVQTFLNLQRTSPGLNAENVLTQHVVLSGARESMAIEDRVTRIPGVRAAGLISLLPLQDSNWAGGFHIPGRPEIFEAELRYVSPGYFRAMGIPLRRGREFSARDDSTTPLVILVNETLARLYFPHEDPVGIHLDRGNIIGVVGDVRQSSLRIPARPEIYYAVSQNFAQIGRLGSTLVVRSAAPAASVSGAIRQAIHEVNPGQALFRIESMPEVIDDTLATPRLYAWLLGLFAAMGTLLAVAGIYGVIAYLVALRNREFGIRMALGADAVGIARFVMARGASLAALGLVLGAGGAFALTRVLRSTLYGVGATDPATYVSVAVLLGIFALAACLVPACRAARVAPAVALRCE